MKRISALSDEELKLFSSDITDRLNGGATLCEAMAQAFKTFEISPPEQQPTEQQLMDLAKTNMLRDADADPEYRELLLRKGLEHLRREIGDALVDTILQQLTESENVVE